MDALTLDPKVLGSIQIFMLVLGHDAQLADDAWSTELNREFGAAAGDKRYHYQEGGKTPALARKREVFHRRVVEYLASIQLYRDYERACGQAGKFDPLGLYLEVYARHRHLESLGHENPNMDKLVAWYEQLASQIFSRMDRPK